MPQFWCTRVFGIILAAFISHLLFNNLGQTLDNFCVVWTEFQTVKETALGTAIGQPCILWICVHVSKLALHIHHECVVEDIGFHAQILDLTVKTQSKY